VTATTASTSSIVVCVDGPASGYRHRHCLRLVDNGTGELLLSAGARADLAAHGAVETRAGRETQQRVKDSRHVTVTGLQLCDCNTIIAG